MTDLNRTLRLSAQAAVAAAQHALALTHADPAADHRRDLEAAYRLCEATLAAMDLDGAATSWCYGLYAEYTEVFAAKTELADQLNH